MCPLGWRFGLSLWILNSRNPVIRDDHYSLQACRGATRQLYLAFHNLAVTRRIRFQKESAKWKRLGWKRVNEKLITRIQRLFRLIVSAYILQPELFVKKKKTERKKEKLHIKRAGFRLNLSLSSSNTGAVILGLVSLHCSFVLFLSLTLLTQSQSLSRRIEPFNPRVQVIHTIYHKDTHPHLCPLSSYLPPASTKGTARK